MPRLLDDVRTVLQADAFTTQLLQPDSSVLYFEDSTVMGHVHVLASAAEILQTWETLQDTFLQRNTSRLLVDPTKAWNLYTILLASPTPPADLDRALSSVEDDFRGTRKIARAGVLTKHDIATALSPILSLQNVSSVTLIDANTRLAERLESVSPSLPGLVTGTPIDSLVASLLGDK